jgi:segregation and condensation protein A
MTPITEVNPLTVRVEEFEGPLDLLLHLCRTNEVDLSRLPIRTITDRYLAQLEAMEFQDLETAGAFLVMAATLVYLKSKLLLPEPEAEELLDDESEQLRLELEERLRAYAAIKETGSWLAEREAAQALLFGRTGSELPHPDEIPLEDLSVHLIERGYRKLLEVASAKRDREVEPEPPSVLERMSRLLELLRHTWSLLFSTIIGRAPIRTEVVVTLLALLELVRLGQVKVRQRELFGDIVIEQSQGVKGERVHP